MKYTIAFTLCLITIYVKAQDARTVQRMKDSLRLDAYSEIAKKYPLLRQGFVSVDFIGGSSTKAKLNNKEIYEGKAAMTRLRSNFNIPIVSWGKNSIIATMSYQQLYYQTNDVKSLDASFVATDRSFNKSNFGLTTTFVHTDSIFNRPVNFAVGATALTDELSSIKRVTYFGRISMPIKRTQNTSLTVGLVGIVDPSAVTPIIPIISYWHRFKASNMELFVDLPSRVALRKQWGKRSWTTIGSELGGNMFFFNLNQPSLPQNTIYTSLEIRTGATFEYLLTKKIIVGINGGLNSTVMSRMFDKGNKQSDYFASTGSSTSPYISFSVSFLPFIKSLKSFR